ncbi:hypothetical protein QBZ16_004993 [Prototheca wickerhamii]|uniref:Rad21/Rec8-like protein C-terminal eukaryotic domain-containing protein n=1 Tax=Prototheca wickerhamii TaxID=3111 RepID=A0AAD9IFC1_PROWI|nr:hypothetical protein QBZ16_004993 [Prototheca wickerhamii]
MRPMGASFDEMGPSAGPHFEFQFGELPLVRKITFDMPEDELELMPAVPAESERASRSARTLDDEFQLGPGAGRQELGQELFEVPNLPDFDMLAWQPDADLQGPAQEMREELEAVPDWLRAALSTTPEMGRHAAGLLGERFVTPGSIAKRQRVSSLRSESLSALASDSSLLGARGDLDMMLPAVDELPEPAAVGSPWRPGVGATQFELVETLGTEPSRQSSELELEPASAAVLSALTVQSERLGSAALSFQGLAAGRLDRSEAARFFHQILVLHSRGSLRVEQPKPFEDLALHLVTAA